MLNTKGSISNFSCFFTKDSTKKSFFWAKFCFALRRNFTNQDVPWSYFSTNSNNTIFVKVLKCFFAKVWNIASDLFVTKFCCSTFEFFNFKTDRSVNIFFNKSFINNDSVFEVVTFPVHISDKDIFTESKFAIFTRIAINNDLTFLNFIAFLNARFLVNTSFIICFFKFSKGVDIFVAVRIFNSNFISTNITYNTIIFAD